MRKVIVWVLVMVVSAGCLGAPAWAQSPQDPVAPPYQTPPPPSVAARVDTAYTESAPPPANPAYCRGPSGEAIIADALIVRPIGIAAMVAGFAGAIVAMPFAAASNSTDAVGRALLVAPFDYTFRRPLGDFGYGQCSDP